MVSMEDVKFGRDDSDTLFAGRQGSKEGRYRWTHITVKGHEDKEMWLQVEWRDPGDPTNPFAEVTIGLESANGRITILVGVHAFGYENNLIHAVRSTVARLFNWFGA